MHIHILGICGTFMGGIALLARQLGYKVTGSDTSVYPPMSTQLSEQGITLMEGYKVEHLDPAPDIVVIGNALSRGNPAIEHVLNQGLKYTSGPAFLAEYILQDRWVIAVAGTHGKTTTSCMLSWILEEAKLKPGFLIGGVSQNFGISARLGEPPFFVVEADEYDSAFFDKRSKFVHYHPRTLIINNIEFDHADIFPDLEAIKKQFHHLVRTVPNNGLIVTPTNDNNANNVIDMGCWTPTVAFADSPDHSSLDTSSTDSLSSVKNRWHVKDLKDDSSKYEIYKNSKLTGGVDWALIGKHNALNGLASIIAAEHAGVPVKIATDALKTFKNAKRRMEVRANVNNITVYDDFAHHPTAIQSTLSGLRKHVGESPIIAVLEPRSNTMRMGIHKNTLGASLAIADQIILYQPENLGWDLGSVGSNNRQIRIFDNIDAIISYIIDITHGGEHILIMSNGAFAGIHEKLIKRLENGKLARAGRLEN
ncbi:MAG: UDP-N-acetylmuramate:L-alanyl-gamma-D-glutamyl-meso-diaminopimelate ligase [Gammaproteobacteria bacterium]|nr:UDP-N-acetylmuramate:L-alanyl-gamma-D-glutamyl-meso-diaminopimelate ligase [Gammaproteobacteria bacterium]